MPFWSSLFSTSLSQWCLSLNICLSTSTPTDQLEGRWVTELGLIRTIGLWLLTHSLSILIWFNLICTIGRWSLTRHYFNLTYFAQLVADRWLVTRWLWTSTLLSLARQRSQRQVIELYKYNTYKSGGQLGFDVRRMGCFVSAWFALFLQYLGPGVEYSQRKRPKEGESVRLKHNFSCSFPGFGILK